MFGQRWFGKVGLFLAAAILSFTVQSAVPNQVYRDALWVAESHGVLKLLAADSSIEVEIDSAEEVRAVAVDSVAGRVWVARTARLVAHGFDGVPQQDIPLAYAEIGPAKLSVDRRDGSVWLGRGTDAQAFSFDGTPISSHTFPDTIVAI